VNAWLEELLWERKGSMEVYRCKGVLNILGSDEVHIIQVVDGWLIASTFLRVGDGFFL